MALENKATPSPKGRIDQLKNEVPEAAKPTGTTTIAATTIPTDETKPEELFFPAREPKII